MITVTLPKKLTAGGDVVILSRRDYERFILAERKVKSKKTFTPSQPDKAELTRARRNFRAGKYIEV